MGERLYEVSVKTRSEWRVSVMATNKATAINKAIESAGWDEIERTVGAYRARLENEDARTR